MMILEGQVKWKYLGCNVMSVCWSGNSCQFHPRGVGALPTLNKPWSFQAERPNSVADDMISELRNSDNMGNGGDIS